MKVKPKMGLTKQGKDLERRQKIMNKIVNGDIMKQWAEAIRTNDYTKAKETIHSTVVKEHLINGHFENKLSLMSKGSIC